MDRQNASSERLTLGLVKDTSVVDPVILEQQLRILSACYEGSHHDDAELCVNGSCQYHLADCSDRTRVSGCMCWLRQLTMES